MATLPQGAVAVADAVRRGAVTARAVLEARLARIAALDPRLNAFTAILADRAREEADAVDAQVAAGRDPGPLAGVPFGVKDNYDVLGRTTMAGSIVNRGLPAATADAVLAARLRAAGAVLVGTQNMDEFAYGFTTENAHYGPTRNPRDTRRSAGGSSGGSAASVAAGLVDLALGSDTNGSIRVPASFCGIFGLKPTYGRLPRTGTFPFVHELDHAGPLARSAADLALVYDCLQGHDSGDFACADRPSEPTSLADPPAGTRVAILDGWFHDMADDDARAAVAKIAAALGATDRVTLPGAEKARAAAFLLTMASAANLHRATLIARAGDYDPATRDRLLAGLLAPADPVQQAQRYRHAFREEARAAFAKHDLLLAPATPCAAPLLGQPTIRVAGADLPTRANAGILTQPISFIGLPVVAVPVSAGALPIAVQIIARPWAEALALQAAAKLERDGVAGLEMAAP
ncbi:MAG TPA: AtzE family amidohydrolase [Sphingomonas sp.]